MPVLSNLLPLLLVPSFEFVGRMDEDGNLIAVEPTFAGYVLAVGCEPITPIMCSPS